MVDNCKYFGFVQTNLHECYPAFVLIILMSNDPKKTALVSQ
jgi:hypothetical protein